MNKGNSAEVRLIFRALGGLGLCRRGTGLSIAIPSRYCCAIDYWIRDKKFFRLFS